MLLRKIIAGIQSYFVNCLIAPLFFTVGVILFICVLFYPKLILANNVMGLLTSYNPQTEESIYEKSLTVIEDNANAEVDIKYLPYGNKFAELTIESLSMKDIPVFNCDDYGYLKYGWGLSQFSRYPGEGGKSILSGHKEKNTALLKIQPDAEIIVKTVYGTFRYTVTETKVVNETDTTVMKPDDTKEQLVLYTCYPLYQIGHHTQRFVVTADLKSGPKVKNIPFQS